MVCFLSRDFSSAISMKVEKISTLKQTIIFKLLECKARGVPARARIMAAMHRFKSRQQIKLFKLVIK